MTNPILTVERLSDDELMTDVERAAKDERRATAHLIVLLTEVDARTKTESAARPGPTP